MWCGVCGKPKEQDEECVFCALKKKNLAVPLLEQVAILGAMPSRQALLELLRLVPGIADERALFLRLAKLIFAKAKVDYVLYAAALSCGCAEILLHCHRRTPEYLAELAANLSEGSGLDYSSSLRAVEDWAYAIDENERNPVSRRAVVSKLRGSWLDATDEEFAWIKEGDLADNGHEDEKRVAAEIYEGAEKVSELEIDYAFWRGQRIEKGSTVEFGWYPKMRKGNEEAIAWTVLSCRYGNVVVITKDIVDCHPYESSGVDVGWVKSGARVFLNDVFYNEAFSYKDKKSICCGYRNTPFDVANLECSQTAERVFLLAYDEAKWFFETNYARRARGTGYANTRGLGKDGWYWLRSSGSSKGRVMVVNGSGGIEKLGVRVNSRNIGIRPAILLRWGESDVPKEYMADYQDIKRTSKP